MPIRPVILAAGLLTLGFFWPRSLDGVFAGDDAAARYGTRAVRVRRAAAVLTDGGALLIGYAVSKRLRARTLTNDARLSAGIGAASVVVSVPLHFAADGYLSRAVWWHNLRYAR